MATLQFFAGQGSPTELVGGSGLGFYGSSFGSSVSVGSYGDTIYITNNVGADQGPQADNFKYIASDNPGTGSGILNGSTQLNLTSVPNDVATLNIRFSHGSTVQTQNGEVRFYNRTDPDVAPTAVTVKAAEIIHPDPTQVDNGSGDADWITPGGSTTVVDLIDSPGTSGERPDGASTTDTQHDWYIVMSSSPDSIGSKTEFGLYCSLEYL